MHLKYLTITAAKASIGIPKSPSSAFLPIIISIAKTVPIGCGFAAKAAAKAAIIAACFRGTTYNGHIAKFPFTQG